MIQTEDYEIVGSYNNQIISSIDAERSVNLFEYHDAHGKKPKALVNTSGLINANFMFIGANGGVRKQFVFNNIMYVVVGDRVYQISNSANVIPLGTISNSAGYIGMEANTFQVIIVNGQNGYIFDTNSQLFSQITDPAFPASPIDVSYLDGFFIVADGGTNNFQLSSFNQGLIWGPDNSGGSNTSIFTMTSGNPSIQISTFGSGASANNYAVGTPIVITNLSTPVTGITNGNTYYIAAIIDASHVEISASDGGIVITPDVNATANFTNNGQLQEGSITTHPGTIVACRTLHRRLFLFSQFFTEVWENAGIGTNLPFRRNNALLMEYGCAAIGSVSVGFDLMCFLSQTRDGLGSVMQVAGTESLPISTSALDAQLAQYANQNQVSDCRAFLLKENNIIFYRMNFTAANHTFVYNISMSNPQADSSKLWHEEEMLNGNRHVSQTHAYFNINTPQFISNNLVGHYSLPIIYMVDNNTYTNDGEAIHRTRITKAIVPPGYQRMRIDRLQMDLLQGNILLIDSQFEVVELLTENSQPLLTEGGDNLILEQQQLISNPENLYVFLSISKDGGQTYGYEVRAPMGNIGQRKFRTLWRKLGVVPRGQAFVCKFEFYQAVPFIILGASWAKEVLPE